MDAASRSPSATPGSPTPAAGPSGCPFSAEAPPHTATLGDALASDVCRASDDSTGQDATSGVRRRTMLIAGSACAAGSGFALEAQAQVPNPRPPASQEALMATST